MSLNIKKNITKFKNCYGCGVCVVSCPINIISFCENSEGFYQPVINEQQKCIECGACLDVCSFNHTELATSNTNPVCFAAYSKNNKIRKSCSSGGLAYEITYKLISEGYKACVVKYNFETHRASHYIASTIEDLESSKGSKYIQSNTILGFQSISKKDGKYVVIGTPCQIDSFRRYIKRYRMEDRFVLIDFFCHGVPSYLMWDKYIKEIEEQIGPIISLSFRDKTNGWHDSWTMDIKGKSLNFTEYVDSEDAYSMECREIKNSYHKGRFEGDLFYEFFLGNYCLNQCCYESCKYKGKSSSADIRLGDLWGKKYSSDHKGTSGVMTFTEKGLEIVNKLECCILIKEPYEIVSEGQMERCANKPYISNIVSKFLRKEIPLNRIKNLIISPYRISLLPKRAIKKLIRLIREH